jgi:hypothetical protein
MMLVATADRMAASAHAALARAEQEAQVAAGRAARSGRNAAERNEAAVAAGVAQKRIEDTRKDLAAAMQMTALASTIAHEITRAARRAAEVTPPVADVAGFELQPNPLTAQSEAELVEMARTYRTWAGAPSFRKMAAQAGQAASYTTLRNALLSDELPAQRVFRAIIAGCGGDEEEQSRYVTAWRQFKVGAVNAEPAAVGPPVLRAVPPPAAEVG